jgi:ribosomal protein S18 acetylase RimI-like enzyme
MEKSLKIKKIFYEKDIPDLKYFFENICGQSVNTFSYFLKRELSVIKHHIATNLVFDDLTPIAYSHLDREDDKVWFGICVGQEYVGRKIGSFLLDHTIQQAIENKCEQIDLSVYKDNLPAINLYKKFGFMVYNQNRDSFFMKRIL